MIALQRFQARWGVILVVFGSGKFMDKTKLMNWNMIVEEKL